MCTEQETSRAIELYSDMIRRICLLHLKNHADTEDVFQERFRALSAHLEEARAALAFSQEALLKQEAAFSQEEDRAPTMKEILDSYPHWESAAQKNAFLREAAGRIVYAKTEGGRWTPSNLRLYFFPPLGAQSPCPSA